MSFIRPTILRRRYYPYTMEQAAEIINYLSKRVELLYNYLGLKEGLVSSRQDFNFNNPEESVRRIVAEGKK